MGGYRTYLLLICVQLIFIICSCEPPGSEDNEPMEDTSSPSTSFEEDFRAEIDGPGGLEFFTPDGENELVICVGEKVTFLNTTQMITTTEGQQDETGPYSGPIEWDFQGGDPNTETENLVTVCYDTPGKFDVVIKLPETSNSQQMTFPDFVCVVDKEPIDPLCFLETETGSDGSMTTFMFDSDNTLFRSERIVNGILQEVGTYICDSLATILRLKEQQLFNGSNQLLFNNTYAYNSPDNLQVTAETLEDGNANLIASFNYNWDAAGFVRDAVLETPDGLGGILTTDIVYTYDTNNENVLEEEYTQNGIFVGRVEYTFDDNPKLTFGLNIQSFPFRNNTNNPTSITTYDSNNTIINQRTSDYQYDSESCNQPIFEDRFESGDTSAWSYTYVK